MTTTKKFAILRHSGYWCWLFLMLHFCMTTNAFLLPSPTHKIHFLATSKNNGKAVLQAVKSNVRKDPPSPSGTTAAAAATTKTTIPVQTSCEFCKTTFASRNAFFRHLQTDGCSEETPCPPWQSYHDPANGHANTTNTNNTLVKQSVAIWFGYVGAKDDDSTTHSVPYNEAAGQLVYEALQACLQQDSNVNQTATTNSTTTSSRYPQFRLLPRRSQSSRAKLRSPVLQQEPDCAAARDFLHVSISCLNSSLPELQERLTTSFYHHLQDSVEHFHNNHDNSIHLQVKLWACKLLDEDIRMHAERSCTQLVYHYMVPLHWLPGGHALQQQWTKPHMKPPADSLETLRRFKAALRAAESPTAAEAAGWHKKDGANATTSATKKSSQQQHFKLAAGRYGRLGAKERKAWHNFADPTLRGKASPNQEPVWRVIDACRMVRVDDLIPRGVIVVEVRGDAFLPQQVRRIIGTAIAMTHGWLEQPQESDDLWRTALLRPDMLKETALAPAGRLYLAGARFHFEESRTSGLQLFDTDICGTMITPADATTSSSKEEHDPKAWMQNTLLATLANDSVERMEDEWLQAVKEITAPRMQSALNLMLQSANRTVGGGHSIGLIDNEFEQPFPPEYEQALEKLRSIVREAKWPDTSVARSSVIRGLDRTDLDEGARKAGSFTVINPAIADEFLQKDNNRVLPLGNRLFPDLAQAVFDLEANISPHAIKVMVAPDGQIISCDGEGVTRRSSHCAVNCNAQFTPHVDSGRGAGQSLSIIAGLGNYKRGELIVEGSAFDIRYKPYEFDGWALRHHTNFFDGERFSLVWFTPEEQG